MLAGSDPRLFVRRLADLFTGRDPAGGDVVLTLDPAVQQAAMAGLEGVTGAVVALDPVDRRGPGHGQHADLRPEPAVQPRPGRDPRLLRSSSRPPTPTRGSTRRSASNYPPGSMFKVIVSAAALEDGLHARDRRSRRPTCSRCPARSTTLENFNGGRLQPAAASSR